MTLGQLAASADSGIFVNFVDNPPTRAMSLEPGMEVKFIGTKTFTSSVDMVCVSHGRWHIELSNPDLKELELDPERGWIDPKNPSQTYSAVVSKPAANQYSKGNVHTAMVPKNQTMFGIARQICGKQPIDLELKVETQLSTDPKYGTFFRDPNTHMLYFGRSGGTRIYPSSLPK
jgi:hypothetical protein